MAEKKEYRVRELEASRGNILSYDGRLMATSVPVFDIYFDASVVDLELFRNNIDSLSAVMAGAFPQKTAKQWKESLSTAKAEGKGIILLSRHFA